MGIWIYSRGTALRYGVKIPRVSVFRGDKTTTFGAEGKI